MQEKIISWILVGVALVLLAGIFLSLGERQIVVSNDNNLRKVSVSGTVEKEVMPDKALLRLSVLTEGKTAKEVQDENSLAMEKVINALKYAGVKKEEIETTNYNLYPWQEYDPQSQKMVDKGYRLTNTITLTTTNLEQMGNYLDVSVKNGINQVEGISFTLSDEKEKEIKEELISKASEKAKSKAQSLASGLGASLGEIMYITESSYNGGYYNYRYADTMLSAAKESAPAPNISPEKVTVSLTVTVEYRLN